MWTSVVSNAWVPINYANFPSKKSRRDELLVQDSVFNVTYPSQGARQSNSQRVAEWHLGRVLMYTAFVALQLL